MYLSIIASINRRINIQRAYLSSRFLKVHNDVDISHVDYLERWNRRDNYLFSLTILSESTLHCEVNPIN